MPGGVYASTGVCMCVSVSDLMCECVHTSKCYVCMCLCVPVLVCVSENVCVRVCVLAEQTSILQGGISVTQWRPQAASSIIHANSGGERNGSL